MPTLTKANQSTFHLLIEPDNSHANDTDYCPEIQEFGHL